MTLFVFKIWFFILIFISQFYHQIQSKSQDNFTYGMRFRSLYCQSDNETMITRYCYLRPLSRKTVTFNVGVTFLVPLTKFYVRMIIYYRYGTIFRQVLDINDFDFCNLFDKPNINPLMKLVIDMMRNRVPKVFHKCPYVGEWDLKNYTVVLEFLDHTSMLFPQGIYKVDTLIIFNGSIIHKTITTIEAKSPLKESFG